MFVAFIAAVIAIALALIVSHERKSMIIEEPSENRQAKANGNNEIKKVSQPSVEPAPAQKNSSLNLILYLGCFLVVSSMIGFVSYVDKAMVPIVVISTTLITLLASILLRKNVPFLKSSSLAFNISAMIMFLFWFPSLESLDFPSGYLGALVLSVAFLASIFSAATFNIKALYFLPFLIFIPLAPSLFSSLSEALDTSDILLYGAPISILAGAVVCRYLWRAHCNIPVAARLATVIFSIVYFVLGVLWAAGVLFTEEAPFACTLSLALAILFFYVDLSLANKSFGAIRIAVQGVIIAAVFDGLVVLEADNSTAMLVLTSAISLTALIQGAMSTALMLKKPTEKCHNTERVVAAVAMAVLAICAYICSVFRADLNYSSRYDITYSDLSMVFLIIQELSLFLGALLGVASIFIDRNARMVVPSAMLIAAIVCDIETSGYLFQSIMIGILSLVSAFSFFAIRNADEKHAMNSSLSACLTLAFISFCYCVSGGSGYWIPIFIASAVVLIFGYTGKNTKTIDAGYYVGAFALALLLGDISSSIFGDTHVVLMTIAWTLLPAAFILRDFVHETKNGLPRKITWEYLVGAIGFWIISFSFNTSFGYADENWAKILGITILLIGRIAILIYSIFKKSTPMIILSSLFVATIIISTLGVDMWGILLLTGVGLIAFAITAIYKASVKNQAQNTIQPSSTEPTKNTDIQVEKTEDTDKKTLA